MNKEIDEFQPIIIKTKSMLISKNKVPKNFISNSGETYKWIWLPSSDIDKFLSVRNAEHVISNTRNTSPITKSEHLSFLQKYESLQRIDFVLQDEATSSYIGGMNIALTNYGFEIGKYIGNTDYLGRGVSYAMSKGFIDFVTENISEITKIRAVTRIDNFININLNFKLGFKIVQLVEENFWLMEMK